MKLTKGALTMLLAQYRAIYKNAFIKGLASAALATAVLASGSASAGKLEALNPDAEGVVTVKESTTADSDTGKLPDGTKKLVIAGAQNSKLTVTKGSGGSAPEALSFGGLESFDIQTESTNKGTLEVGADSGAMALTIEALESNINGKIDVKKSGTLNLNGTISSLSGEITNSNVLNINTKTTNISELTIKSGADAKKTTTITSDNVSISGETNALTVEKGEVKVIAKQVNIDGKITTTKDNAQASAVDGTLVFDASSLKASGVKGNLTTQEGAEFVNKSEISFKNYTADLRNAKYTGQLKVDGGQDPKVSSKLSILDDANVTLKLNQIISGSKKSAKDLGLINLNNGTLTIDAKTETSDILTLDDLVFAAADGKEGIVVDGTNGGNIVSNNVAVKGDVALANLTANKLTVKANTLTVGTSQASAKAGSGVKEFIIKDKLTINGAITDGKSTAKLMEKVTLDNEFGGVIDGNDFTNEGLIKVVQGAWTSDSSIALTSGAATTGVLNVAATADKKASLTLSKLDISGATGTDPHIVVGGTSGSGTPDVTESVLDLEKTQITNSATPNTNLVTNVDKKGTIKTSTENFKHLLAGKLTIKDGGTVSVNDEIEIAEDKLAAAASASGTLGLVGTLKGTNIVVKDASTTATDAGITVAATGALDFNDVAFDVSDKAESSNEVAKNKVTANVSGGIIVHDNLAVYKNSSVDANSTLTVAANKTLELSSGGASNSNQVYVKNINAETVKVDDNWMFNGANLTVKNLTVGELSSIENGGKLTSDSGAASTVTLDGSATFSRLDVKDKGLTVNGSGDREGKLFISGTTEKDNKDKDVIDVTLAGNLTLNKGAYVEFGKDAVGDLVGADGTVSKDQATLLGKIIADGSSTVSLALDSSTSLNKEKLMALKDAFSGKGNEFGGFINIGDAKVEGSLITPNADNRYNWEAPSGSAAGTLGVKDLAQLKFTNNVLENAVIEIGPQHAGNQVMGSFGSLYQKEGNSPLTLKGDTVLNTSSGANKWFITNSQNGSEILGSAKVAENSNLVLNNGGEIKKVDLSASGAVLLVNNTADSVTKIDEIKGTTTNGIVSLSKGTVEVAQDVTAEKLYIDNSNVALKKNIKTAITEVENGGSLTVTNYDIATKANTPSYLNVFDNSVANIGGKLTAESGANAYLTVGDVLDAKDKESKDTNGTLFVKDASGYKGNLELVSGAEKASLAVFGAQEVEVTNTLAQNEKRSAIAPLADAPTTPSKTKENKVDVNYTANVGYNSAVAFGFDSVDSAVEVLKASHQMLENGSLYSSMKEDIKAGDTTTKAYGDAIAAINAPTSIAATGKLNLNYDNTKVKAGDVTLGKYSQLVVTDKAFGANKDKVALSVADVANNHVNVIDATKTKGVLVGDFTQEDIKKNNLKLFQEKALSFDAKSEKQTFTVYTANGLLFAEVGADGKISEFKLDKNGINKLTHASTPVREYILGIATGKVATKKFASDKQEGGMPQAGLISPDVANHFEAQNKFVNSLANQMDGGLGIEQSARFAVYGGSVKAAELASKAGTDAIKSYTKVTANVATAQTATGSIFVVPTYKSSDSDSFNAEGVDFGSDIKLSGVALGADYMVAPNVKVGAMFNIGTGDADGKGIASGFETDLDYVGGGLFLNYNQDALNITADLTYTQSSADMKATIVDNKVSADVDTTVLSLGVQGSYKFDLDGSYATPYAGVRFSKYSIDDYTLSAKGMEYMSNTFDDMTVFSIPVGVELGTQMTAGDWTVEPSLDLGVTFNLGDTDLTHSATAVTKTSGVNLTSEVLDDVVFGIKGALKANYNGLSLGLGLGYEVGSNADDLSVQATGVYTF